MEKIITKRGVSFKVFDNHRVQGYCPNGFFTDCVMNGDWENDTFHILEKFAGKDVTYIDVGAWIGPTVLFSACLYKQVLCFEADPIALLSLEYNILLNDFDHIILEKKALAAHNGSIDFGGNWELGNSESTMLVNDASFLSEYNADGQRGNYQSRTAQIVQVDAVTIETAIDQHRIDAKRIGLIKMDIEGGEYIVIPAMEDFLKRYKPNLYISLHFVYLVPFQIEKILKILFDIYRKCYTYVDGKEVILSASEIIRNKIELLVFEKQ